MDKPTGSPHGSSHSRPLNSCDDISKKGDAYAEVPPSSSEICPTFQAAFEKEAYSIVRDPFTGVIVAGPVLGHTLKSLSRAQWEHRVHVLRNYEVGDAVKGLSKAEFQKANRQTKTNLAHFAVDGGPIEESVRLYRFKKIGRLTVW